MPRKLSCLVWMLMGVSWLAAPAHAAIEVQITASNGDANPDWSPDGTEILFDSNRTGGRGLWSITAAGGTAVPLTFLAGTSQHPAWSPDGTTQVFSADLGSPPADIYTRPSSGGAPTILDADSLSADEHPAWSPDGSQIAYTKAGDIYVIPSTGGPPVQLTTHAAIDRYPTWSPDGATIAFQSARAGNFDIWLIPAAGGAPTQLTTDPAHDGEPDWSPTGSLIVFKSLRTGNNDLWLIPAGGGPLVQLTSNPQHDAQPSWDPTGKQIVFARDGLWVTTPSLVDVRVTKLVDKTAAAEGDTLQFTVVAANLSASAGTNVEITDLLPAGLTYVSDSATHGFYTSGTGVWMIDPLAATAAESLFVSATVDPGTHGSTITNIAALTQADQADPNETNDADSVSVTVTAADLSVTKIVDDPAPDEGDTIVYTVTVANGGPDTATGVEVTDLLPAGVTYSSDIPTQGAYAGGTGVWSVGSLASGAMAALDITATVDPGTAGATIWNTATRTASDQPDTSAANDADSVSITVRSSDLQITKVVDDPTPGEGGTIVYTVTVTNGGPDDATGVEVTDALPAGVTYVSDTPSQGAYTPGTGVWSAGALANGAAATLDITATLDPGTAGFAITNAASRTGSLPPDTNPSNDADSVSVSVGAPAVTLFQVTVGPGHVRPAWSPDGAELVFESQGDLFRVPAAGGTVVPVVGSGSEENHPDRSPTADLVVYGLGPSAGQTKLHTATTAGGSVTTLPSGPGVNDEYPHWSPDGTRIAFGSDADLLVLTHGTGALDTLTTGADADTHPTWSPDGLTLAFQSDRAGSEDVWTIPSAGGSPVQMTTDPATDGHPDWAPDGTRIAFHSTRSGLGEIWMVPAGGGAPVAVTSDSVGSAEYPDWSCNGNQIAFSRGGSIWIASFAGVDVRLHKSVDNTLPTSGQDVTFTVIAVNRGPNAATGVTVTDVLPPGTTLVSQSASQGTYGAGLWDIGALANGQSDTLSVTVTVTAPAGSTVTNTAALASVDQMDGNSTNDQASASLTVATGVSAEPVTSLPDRFSLARPRPNPSRGEVVIQFEVPVAAFVTLAIHDVAGRRVQTIVRDEKAAGRYASVWNGRDATGARVSPGMYFIRMQAGSFVSTRKAIRLR